MSSDETRFTQSVFAVREDNDGADGVEFVDHSLKLDVVHKPSTSVLFRLSIPIAVTDSTSTKVTIYLQITPDRIISLRNTACDTSDTNERTPPPYLDRVLERLGGARLSRASSLHAQLVVPTDFSLHEAPDSPARRLFASVSSLATASLFSLYMPHNVLPMKKFRNFEQAVRQFPTLTATERHAFERMVNLRGLYRGKGGVVYTPEDQDAATAAVNATASDATTESDAATVAFDTPSRYRDSPPKYEESPSEGHQSSGKLDAAIGCAPPAYDDSDGGEYRPMTSKRLLHCGSEDIDLHLDLHPPKRIFRHPRKGQMHKQMVKKISRHHPTNLGPDLNFFESRLQLQLERQQRLIEQLQKDIKTLQKRNKELEGRQGELEESHGVLENRQGETEEAVESILVHTGELDEECEKLGKQVPDIGDEVEDWMKSSMGDTMKDYMADWLKENMSDSIQDYISQQVTAQIAEVKTKMRSALGD
ncbi:hypothetical protein PG997_011531 [Apiospora hydei]|uniref:Uncharacterized protein n=1 Tax=Apiospora hydei TaxID=1337664 RepID=A0ABR1VN97_9PEZI